MVVMAMHLDPAGLASAARPDRLDRHGPEARQNRWLLELERAAFGLSAAPAPGGVRREAAAGSPAGQARPRPAHDAGIGPGAASEGQRAAAGPAPRAAADTHSGPAPARTPPSRAPDAGAAARGAAPASVAPPGPTPHAAAQRPLPPSAGAVAHAGRDGVAGAAADPALAASPLAPAADATRDAFGPALLALAAPEATAAPEIEEAPDPGHGAPAEAQAEPYGKRLLHVYRGQDGVQAWVRDAALTQAQVGAVAEAMAGQLAAAGSVLAALTVNGRRVVSAAPGARGAGAQDQSTAPATPHGAPAVQGVSA
jgi:hypothetical protein